MLVIPFVPSIGNYDFETVIDDTPYVFDVRWNEYDQAWYFDIAEVDGTKIACGLKIVCGTYIGRYSTHALFENGVITAIDTSGGYRDPTFDDLGTRVAVHYYTLRDIVSEVYAG